MIIEKSKRLGIRQTVTLLAYLLPSLNPSSFELEAPFTLEETARRLSRLERVRVSRENPISQAILSDLMGNTKGGAWRPANDTVSTSTTPIDVSMAVLDDDTFRYLVQYHDDRFSITVKGFIKRWDGDTTFVTGKVHIDMHYIGLVVKSLIYAVLALGISLITLAAGQMFLFATELGQAIYDLYNQQLLKFMPLVFWLIALGILWLNEVVIPAQSRRIRLVTRIEDMLLIPFLVKE